MKLKNEFEDIIQATLDTKYPVQAIENNPLKCEKIADSFAIQFHNWMRLNDTPENAERFFMYSDEDMLNVFKEEYYETKI